MSKKRVQLILVGLAGLALPLNAWAARGNSSSRGGDSSSASTSASRASSSSSSSRDNDSNSNSSSASNSSRAPARVALCHLPPGNRNNAQTIEVGHPAYDAHLAHGDSAGACVNATTQTSSNDVDSNGRSNDRSNDTSDDRSCDSSNDRQQTDHGSNSSNDHASNNGSSGDSDSNVADAGGTTGGSTDTGGDTTPVEENDEAELVALCHIDADNPTNNHVVDVGHPAYYAHLEMGAPAAPCPSVDPCASADTFVACAQSGILH